MVMGLQLAAAEFSLHVSRPFKVVKLLLEHGWSWEHCMLVS